MTNWKMPPKVLAPILLGLVSISVAETAAPSDAAQIAVETEVAAVDAAFVAVRQDRDTAPDTGLATPGKGAWATQRSSVALARRAAAVCGILRNEGDYARAEKLATRVIRKLEKMDEGSDVERAERLYWEAWLEAEVLGARERPISLLKEAEQLSPKDERIIELALKLVSAATPWPGNP